MSQQWQPGANIETLKLRAAINADIRQFFAARNVMEVETPLLANAGVTDPHLVNFTSDYHLPGAESGHTLYLQTSPEYAMKRLLAANMGSIYQICKAFRNEEQGRFHNPEFTMLEWYRIDFDHWQLMDEVEALVSKILQTGAFERISYQEAFKHYLGIDPMNAELEQLKDCCNSHGFNEIAEAETHLDTLLQLLFSHVIEPKIGKETPCFVYNFPASQAALAKISSENTRVAQRFELYFKGVELANGFNELQSAKEQKHRFEADNNLRQQMQITTAKTDQKFLAALENGLPQCAGVALGIDRLLMLKANKSTIDEVLSFSITRA